MLEMEIQVKRGGVWRKVTTLRYERDLGERQVKRVAAVRDGFMKLSEWRASDQFIGLPMRLAEPVGGWGKREFAVVTEIGGRR